MLKRILTLVLALLLCAGALAEAPVLTVQGAATVSLDADTATITLGIRRFDADVRTVQSAVNQRMESVIAALLDAGVAKEDVYTSSISIYPEYDYDGDSPILYHDVEMEEDEEEADVDEEDIDEEEDIYDEAGEIETELAVEIAKAPDDDTRVKGYSASNTITIVTADIENVGAFIDAAFNAGANTLDDVSFSASDTTEASQEALRLAIENGRGKAEIMADAAGMALGGIVALTEGDTYNYGTPSYLAKNLAVAEDAGAGTQVLASKQSVTANVTLQFELVAK